MGPNRVFVLLGPASRVYRFSLALSVLYGLLSGMKNFEAFMDEEEQQELDKLSLGYRMSSMRILDNVQKCSK